MPTTQGTVHLFGVDGTYSNGTVSNASFEDTAAVMAQVDDENGVAIHRRYDDLTTEGTITIIQRSGVVVPTVGTALTFNSIAYEVQRTGRRQEQKNFRVMEIGIKRSASITPA